jgi:hypothetical protein
MFKQLLTAATTIASFLLILTLVALLGTVTQADAVRYSDWVEVTQVTDPLPGQLYAISDDGVIEGQLCLLTPNDFASKQERLADRRFVNPLGESLPFALSLAKLYLPAGQDQEAAFQIGYRLEWRNLERHFAAVSSLTDGVKRILAPRSKAEMEEASPDPEAATARRLEGCAEAIIDAFKDERRVCQLSEVIKENGGHILAVRFSARCLISNPQSGPMLLPDLRVSSFWTNVKLTLGLVNQHNLSAAVLAGEVAG